MHAEHADGPVCAGRWTTRPISRCRRYDGQIVQAGFIRVFGVHLLLYLRKIPVCAAAAQDPRNWP
jgi:hypothetical protein